MVGVPHLTGRQKLYTALVMLAAEPGTIDERLGKAYRLAIVSIDPQLDIVPSLVGEFLRLRTELRKEYFDPGPSRFMSDAERRKWASNIAAQLVAFYDKVARFN